MNKIEIKQFDISCMQRESKTKKILLLCRPSTYEKLNRIREWESHHHNQEISMNEMINLIMEGYIEQWQKN